MEAQTEASLLALIESSPDPICSVDLDFCLLTFNQAFARLVDPICSPDELFAKPISSLLPGPAGSSWEKLLTQAVRKCLPLHRYQLDDEQQYDLSSFPMKQGNAVMASRYSSAAFPIRSLQHHPLLPVSACRAHL